MAAAAKVVRRRLKAFLMLYIVIGVKLCVVGDSTVEWFVGSCEMSWYHRCAMAMEIRERREERGTGDGDECESHLRRCDSRTL